MEITKDSIVYFKDDNSKHPYLVHEVLDNNNVILGLREYPDVEQDFAVSIDEVSLFENKKESNAAEKLIQKLLD